ncbi:hypothetical protein HY375_02260 [Candidatus Berkelbacteria bacterium]|nr:hypothetical protein [Candidatus Berkelbacteria bacterium]
MADTTNNGIAHSAGSGQLPATDWSKASDEEILAADLLIELGLHELPADQQAEVLKRFSEGVEQAVLLRILAQITEKPKQDELQKLIDAGDGAGVKAFIETNVPTHGEITQEEILKFKRIMLVDEGQPSEQ